MAKHLRFLLFALLLSPLHSTAFAANEKIIYHIHSSDPETLHRAIANMENLIAGMPEHMLDIKLLLQGESIQLLYPFIQSADINQRLKRLKNNGVKVEITRENFLKNSQFLDQESVPFLVQNIFSRIIELQKQGYHYITP